MAGPTGLEPATSGVTGRRSNQLNYDPASGLLRIATRWWEVRDLNPRPPACKAGALTAELTSPLAGARESYAKGAAKSNASRRETPSHRAHGMIVASIGSLERLAGGEHPRPRERRIRQ